MVGGHAKQSCASSAQGFHSESLAEDLESIGRLGEEDRLVARGLRRPRGRSTGEGQLKDLTLRGIWGHVVRVVGDASRALTAGRQRRQGRLNPVRGSSGLAALAVSSG
jgi:hypothetical protein